MNIIRTDWYYVMCRWMGEEANVSYAYLKAMKRKRKTEAERDRQIITWRKANLMHMQSTYPTFSSGLLYETGWENRTLLICPGVKEDQKFLSKTQYEYHSHFNIISKWHDRWTAGNKKEIVQDKNVKFISKVVICRRQLKKLVDSDKMYNIFL